MNHLKHLLVVYLLLMAVLLVWLWLSILFAVNANHKSVENLTMHTPPEATLKTQYKQFNNRAEFVQYIIDHPDQFASFDGDNDGIACENVSK